jgi:hypothetical protein
LVLASSVLSAAAAMRVRPSALVARQLQRLGRPAAVVEGAHVTPESVLQRQQAMVWSVEDKVKHCAGNQQFKTLWYNCSLLDFCSCALFTTMQGLKQL